MLWSNYHIVTWLSLLFPWDIFHDKSKRRRGTAKREQKDDAIVDLIVARVFYRLMVLLCLFEQYNVSVWYINIFILEIIQCFFLAIPPRQATERETHRRRVPREEPGVVTWLEWQAFLPAQEVHRCTDDNYSSRQNYSDAQCKNSAQANRI